MKITWAKAVLTPEGWQSDVRTSVDGTSVIAAVDTNSLAKGSQVGFAMSAPGNFCSHGFQRALDGLIKTRNQKGTNSFWTWRKLMYEFIDQLIPEEIETIAKYAQNEMLDTFIFFGNTRLVSDISLAGRHVVRERYHIIRQPNQERHFKTKKIIMGRLIT